jgi:hypothetical protein
MLSLTLVVEGTLTLNVFQQSRHTEDIFTNDCSLADVLAKMVYYDGLITRIAL